MNPQNDKLLIIGAGQYGLVAQEIAHAMGCFSEISFLDDSCKAPATSPDSRHCEKRSDEAIHVIGTSRDLEKFAAQYRFGFVAVGNPEVRRRLVESLVSCGVTPATLIHPTAYVSSSAKLELGCCVEPLAVVQTDAALGTATFVASGAVVRHNATINEFCHIDCNAVVQTGAVVPAATKVACNSVFNKV